MADIVNFPASGMVSEQGGAANCTVTSAAPPSSADVLVRKLILDRARAEDAEERLKQQLEVHGALSILFCAAALAVGTMLGFVAGATFR